MEVREPLRRSFDAVWPPAGTGSRSRPADIHHCAVAVLSECCAGVTCSYHFREGHARHARAGSDGPSGPVAFRHAPDLARKDSRS
ncbi:hypothetical protein SUDANB56_03741 [Streptomyces sp. enrichment culture]